jgi:hypothetical protein
MLFYSIINIFLGVFIFRCQFLFSSVCFIMYLLIFEKYIV